MSDHPLQHLSAARIEAAVTVLSELLGDINALPKAPPLPTNVKVKTAWGTLVFGLPAKATSVQRVDGQDSVSWAINSGGVVVASGTVNRHGHVTMPLQRRHGADEEKLRRSVAGYARRNLEESWFEQTLAYAHHRAVTTAHADALSDLEALTTALERVRQEACRAAASSAAVCDTDVAHRLLDAGFTGSAVELASSITAATV